MDAETGQLIHDLGVLLNRDNDKRRLESAMSWVPCISKISTIELGLAMCREAEYRHSGNKNPMSDTKMKLKSEEKYPGLCYYYENDVLKAIGRPKL